MLPLKKGRITKLPFLFSLTHRPGFSRRIDEANRLVYDIDELQNIKIISCKGHYED